MSKIQIICTKPGLRRAGVEHPAAKVYDADHWSHEDIAAFKADPAFIVQPYSGVADDVNTSGDFDAAVAREVKRQVEAKSAELQAAFNTAVREACDDRIDEASREIDRLKAELGAAKAAILTPETPDGESEPQPAPKKK
ncbi:hypothetical protein IFT84_10300 [Rhizobium sp. CFBP 8762]|uniref:hypothetical protein n=1 Tax=Rhizobium sp. CFBP 8762 TaxID=2775279 RepID=UPI00178156D7|nr:hypothetical protein [Rhizobium sp. CFBP 8762]MBD8554914.1 hypothetical protein [Rhizobium sp. CFBP 8762]